MMNAPSPPTHRAVVRRAEGIAVERVPTPRPGAGELLIAPLIAGLCGTDIQMLRGLRDDPAPVIGHEGVARVLAIGTGAAPDLGVGTLVTVNPTHPTDPSFLLGHNVNGLLQERTLIPATAVEAGLVLPVPELPQIELFALLEPLAVVRYSLGLLRESKPETLVVFGDGIVGQLAARAAPRWLGPHVRTVLIHHTQDGLAWSASHPVGAGLHIGPNLRNAALSAATAGRRTAAVIATPRTATVDCLEAAVASLPEDAVIDLIGGLPPAAATPLLPGADLNAIRAANHGGRPDPGQVAPHLTSAGTRIFLTGHRGVDNRHLLESAAELASAPERYRDLVTHVAGLEEAAGIMHRLSHNADRNFDGRRLIKLAVRIGDKPAREHR